MATHHPPYSQICHSGSTDMSAAITNVCTAAAVFPDCYVSACAQLSALHPPQAPNGKFFSDYSVDRDFAAPAR